MFLLGTPPPCIRGHPLLVRSPFPPASASRVEMDARVGEIRQPLAGLHSTLGLTLLGNWLCRTILAANQGVRLEVSPPPRAGTYRFLPEATAPFQNTWPKDKSVLLAHLPLPLLPLYSLPKKKTSVLFTHASNQHIPTAAFLALDSTKRIPESPGVVIHYALALTIYFP